MARPKKTPDSPDYCQLIRVAAEQLFAEHGYASTTIRDIAKKAGVNSGLLYHYYDNKETLYLTLLEHAVSDLVNQMEAIEKTDIAPDEKILNIAKLFYQQYQAHPQSFDMFHRAAKESHQAALQVIAHWSSRCFASLEHIAEDGVKQGIFRPLPPHQIALTIEAVLDHGMNMSKAGEFISPNLKGDTLLDEIPDMILNLIRA